MQKEHIISISAGHPCYPEDFSHTKPVVANFEAIGNIELLLKPQPALAIVGTRHPTSYGIDITSAIVKCAAQANITIVSGLALGIDGAAHNAALKYGAHTIAVLPSNLRTIYPLRHHSLAEQIVKNGGLLISEYTSIEKPNKYHFVGRNRLIAALSDAIVITEAAMGSGTKHTIEFGHQLGKKLAFVPGPINSPVSDFTNSEISFGGQPLLKPNEIFDLLSVNEVIIGQFSNTIPQGQNSNEQSIINYLHSQNASSEQLLSATQLSAQEFNIHLTMLEIRGVIERTAGNHWRLAN